MIEAATAWAVYPVPTPAGLLLLLLVFHTAPVKSAALGAAQRAGIVPVEAAETEAREVGRDR